jgi:hypothetical protein
MPAVHWFASNAAADRNVRARVPGRCLVLRDERFPSGACDANRSRTVRLSPQGGAAKGREANVRPKEHKWAERQDIGGEQASKCEARESLTAFCRAQRHERKEQILTRGDPGVERLREVSRGHSSDRGTHEQKGVPSEGPKERTEPTRILDGMTKERTKQRGVTTAVATLDWLTAGQTQKAPNPSERSGLCRPRDWEGSIPRGPTAVCGKPHVRWCGRVPGRNPRHPTRSAAVSRRAPLPRHLLVAAARVRRGLSRCSRATERGEGNTIAFIMTMISFQDTLA